MRRIFPLKPVCASSNSPVPNSTSESVQRDKGQPIHKTFGCGKDDSGVVDCHGKDNLKGLKENSLGAKLRHEHLSPVRRPLPTGEENLPFIRDSRPLKVSSKHIVGEDIGFRKAKLISGEHIRCLCSGVASNGKQHVNKNSKLLRTKKSISVPKDHLEEINEAEIRIPAQSNLPRVPKPPQRLFDFCSAKDVDFHTNKDPDKSTPGEPQENARDVDEPNTSSDQSPLLIPSKEASMEVENIRGLLRSQSVGYLTDPYDSFSILIGKTSPKQSGSSVLRGSFSCNGESIANRLSFRGQSARTTAENIIGTLPVNYKSHPTNINSLEMKTPFDWQTITEDEERVGAATEVSVSASEFLNPHSSFSEEDSSSFKLFEDSPTGSQVFSLKDHVDDCISGTLAPFSQTGRFENSLLSSRQKKEDTGRFRMWLEGYQKFEDADEELEKRARTSEEQAQLLSREMELMKPYRTGPTQKGGPEKEDVNMDLKQKLKRLCEDKRNLFLEIASEIRSRLSDRSAANEALKLLKGEIESHVQKAEQEKCAVKSSLENEMDRRSKEWGTKLEKIRSDEKRMRDRLRDLAEQHVGLQREISYLNNKENNLKNQLRESEVLTDGFKTRLKEAENEITLLRQSLAESHKKTKETEDDQQSLRRSYDLKEKENYALQKSIIRLQRLCKDQERTITGLCKGLNDEINDIPQEKNDHIIKLQEELLRVTGEEETLCKDLMMCRPETDALRNENVRLLGIQKSREEGSGYGLIKVDEELRARLEELQSQALSLLDENSIICAKLLEVIKYHMYHIDELGINEVEETLDVLSMEQKRVTVIEHEMNVNRLKRKADSLRKSVHMVRGILKEKTIITCNQTLSQDIVKTDKLQSELCSSEVKEQISELQQELKAETIVSRLLREKLCSREVEVEEFMEEIAKLKERQEILEADIGRLQDLLGTACHKARDLEFQ
ncbi:hypothetical protein KI387_007800, partial [Taxus chinensis]